MILCGATDLEIFRLILKAKEPTFSLHFTLIDGSTILFKKKTSDEALEAINAIRATEYNIIIGHSESKKKAAKAVINSYKQKIGCCNNCNSLFFCENYLPQQYLYFFPEPHGQGSFLPTFFSFITVPESFCSL